MAGADELLSSAESSMPPAMSCCEKVLPSPPDRTITVEKLQKLLVVFHQVFPIPHLYLIPQTHEMADKHLTCPMVAQEQDRAPQESSSPAEPQELCMAQDLEMVVAEGMAPPQRILFPPEKIRMAWQHSQRAGAGLHNLGNTCFLNSVLQCLTYTPPLANHLLSGEHSRACGQKGFCVMCRMEVHVQQVLHSSASAIEPWAVVDFLTVTCWSCQAVSDSYEAFLDVPLDIKAAASVTAALEDFVKPEHLDGENCFKCSKCDKVTAASKRFSVHRVPKVLTVCLKRFEAFTGDKISKVVEYPQYLDLRPYMSQAAGEPLLYSLYAVLVHGGGSCRAGHYFCYIKASDGLWYRMDDKSVDLCDSDTVLRQQAYLLFYIRCRFWLDLMLNGPYNGVHKIRISLPCCFLTVSEFGHGIGKVDGASQLDPGYEPWAVPESMVIKPLGVILFLSLGAIPGRSILWKASRSDHCTPPHPQFANHTYPMDTTHPNSVACWQVELSKTPSIRSVLSPTQSPAQKTQGTCRRLQAEAQAHVLAESTSFMAGGGDDMVMFSSRAALANRDDLNFASLESLGAAILVLETDSDNVPLGQPKAHNQDPAEKLHQLCQCHGLESSTDQRGFQAHRTILLHFRLVVFHQVFPIPHLYLFPQTHEMADKHLTCPMVAQEEDRAPQESSSPAEPQELCMAQDLEMVVAEGMAPPQRILFPPEKICMAWQHSQRAGAGLHNLGNTCFLNSVLQCLTYTPPLANHLLSGEHSRACGQKGFCVMCRMEVHVQQVLHSSASAIEPWAVVDFLTVTCWSCQAVSDSYEAFLDVPLDIKAAASVTAALEDFVKPEHLDGENCFKCSKCDKVTAASKRFTVHRAPKVLTVCLKRFEAFTGDKISKVVEYPQYLDLRPYMSQAAGEPLFYSLYAVLVHGGGSCRAGHYFCYIKASDGLWYRMDDKSVDLCDSDTVLRQQAYLLFYIRCRFWLDLMLNGPYNGVHKIRISLPCCFLTVSEFGVLLCEPGNLSDLCLTPGHGIGKVDGASQLDPGYEPWAVPESMVIKPLGVILFLSLGAIPGRSILWKASRSDHCTPPHSQFANHTYPMDTTHPNSVACWQVEAVLICSSLAKS
ncbi:hypothetical protein Q9966_012924 [Columba livia]|nr:hypothetical protein Q9966_012924 [Columba livia]